MIIESYLGKYPKIDKSVYLSQNTVIIGDVVIGKGSSIWFGSVVRGDVNYIRIGNNTNVQDNSVLHVQHDTGPLIIGNGVTIGHSVNLHGCEIGDNCLIGIGAIVLTGARVGKNCIIAAGALVKENSVVPDGSLVAGIPGVIKKNLNNKEIESIRESANNYINYVKKYRGE
ncbi:MAG: gamma carbonic anhydrase family protein [Deltaproteobacteria bacterium]|nr:gamma carbonic anhydrase family protein [Deltaproteobacteria bacterium]